MFSGDESERQQEDFRSGVAHGYVQTKKCCHTAITLYTRMFSIVFLWFFSRILVGVMSCSSI